MVKMGLGIGVLLCLLGLSSCHKESAQDYADNGRYFVQWDSYLGYTTEESPVLDLSYIEVFGKKDQGSKDIREVSVLSEDQEFVAKEFETTQGSEGNGYRLDGIFVELPPLSVGTHVIRKVKLTFDDDTELIYPVGTWRIEVREPAPSGISYGKLFCMSNLFCRYYAEIRNELEEDIEITGLYVAMSEKTLDIEIGSSLVFDDTRLSNEHTIPPKEIRFFNFQFMGEETQKQGNQFTALRPFLCYTQAGEQRYAAMDIAYDRPVYSDQEIFQLLGDGKVVLPAEEPRGS